MLYITDKRDELVKLRNELTKEMTSITASVSNSTNTNMTKDDDMGRGKRQPVKKRPFDEDYSDEVRF